ncbi:hypothetical protein MMC16_007590 [Acarospora aff. strigata]|nr:hypothetical protein [Acarospora aff. strigata]
MSELVNDPIPSSSHASSPPPGKVSRSSQELKTGIGLGIGISVAMALLAMASFATAILLCLQRRRRKRAEEQKKAEFEVPDTAELPRGRHHEKPELDGIQKPAELDEDRGVHELHDTSTPRERNQTFEAH